MSRNAPVSSANLLIKRMSPDDRTLITPHLERVGLSRESVLDGPSERIAHVYFLEGGIASITSMSAEGALTEVGIFGREGMSGVPLLLGADRSPYETFIQVNHADAHRIPAAKFIELIDRSATLRQLLLRYVQAMMIQMSQSAVANSRYQIEARLARWLLMCRDRTDTDDIPLTHEFMAIMVGAHRSGVTVALHVLEGAGMIRSQRGCITIADRCKLIDLAGDSYGPAEKEYRRLIGPFGE